MMNRVLILYPKEFACLPKFERKVGKILSRLESFEVVYFEDPRGFIAETFKTDQRCRGLRKVNSLEGVTNCIVFDDGEVFVSEREAIEQAEIPYRYIKIKITRVINIKKEPKYANLRSTPTYEYIGRGSDWGNPYSMFDDSGDGLEGREEVIRKYRYDFERGFLKRSKDDALALAGKRLGCFCKPEACHGDIIAEYLNAYDDGE